MFGKYKPSHNLDPARPREVPSRPADFFIASSCPGEAASSTTACDRDDYLKIPAQKIKSKIKSLVQYPRLWLSISVNSNKFFKKTFILCLGSFQVMELTHLKSVCGGFKEPCGCGGLDMKEDLKLPNSKCHEMNGAKI